MKIALVGDIALFGKNTSQNKDYPNRFKPIKEILDRCDYVIGNLETPLTNYDRTIGGKSAYIKGTPEDIELLEYLGISHVSLANNHMFDYGQKGLEDTIKLLEDHHIGWYGINGKKAVIEKENDRIALLGYCCYSTNGKGMGIVNILDPGNIENELNEIKQMLPIVSMHWGEEHVHYPNYDHVETARKLCKSRQIVIHGQHPHVIQGIEKINESLITYSLGNFCFDDVYTSKSKEPLIKLSQDNQESFVLILDTEGSILKKYEIIPFSFAGQQYQTDQKIGEKIEKWSELLLKEKEVFKKEREEALTAYLNTRKAGRDLEWYLKRLNPESAKMILSSRNNQKEYTRLIKNYIS